MHGVLRSNETTFTVKGGRGSGRTMVFSYRAIGANTSLRRTRDPSKNGAAEMADIDVAIEHAGHAEPSKPRNSLDATSRLDGTRCRWRIERVIICRWS